jgi:S-DNA-T family DNA segregation ATPase FtsK/SpoIIIE
MKLILVDPKNGVEMGKYSDIPHLLAPIISEPNQCLSALKWAVNEMERRYGALKEANADKIQTYNKKKKEEGMPYIVIVIDELADFMQHQNLRRELEQNINRIAAKARAVGIHLVLATQSPRKEIITGLIKANINARIALQTNSDVDSRVILNQNGAEKLLGDGDMLFSSPYAPNVKRIQGAFITKDEIEAVANYIRNEGAPEFDDDVVSQPVDTGGEPTTVAGGMEQPTDALFEEAVQLIIEQGQASQSMLITRFSIGFNRAKRLIYTMEQKGIIGPARGAKPREVLVSSLDEALGNHDEDNYEPEPYEENF